MKLFETRPFTWILVAILCIVSLPMAIACFFFSTPSYHGPVSDHFDGKHFFNAPRMTRDHFRTFIKWMLTRKPGPWLDWTDVPYGEPPPKRVDKGALRVTFVNHSTVLIQMDGLNILTDPIWSMRSSPVSWVGPKRHRPPGIRFEDLPPIDVVIINHNHYDHMDVPTLKRLVETYHPRIFVGLGNQAFLERHGIKDAHDMDWWNSVLLSKPPKKSSFDVIASEAKQSHGIATALSGPRNDFFGGSLSADVTLTFVPSRHFSGRSFCDRNRTLWGSFVIKGPAGVVYFAGDTGFGPQFEEIRKRFGPPRLALLPIGAYLPRWFMSPVHLSPEEAVQAHKILGAQTSMAIHFGTFRLGDDGQFEPIEQLFKALDTEGVSPKNFWVLNFGEGRDVPPASPQP